MNKLESIREFLKTPKTDDGRLFFHPIMMTHAASQYGKTYEEFMTDHNVLVESNLHLLEMYDFDAVSVISDPYRETSAFGAKVTFNGDSSPMANDMVLSIDEIKKMEIPNVYECERTLDRIKGVELFREKLGSPFPIIGWIEGPLAESADLVGVSSILMDLIIEPDKVVALMQKCLELGKQFAKAQVEAGANIIGVGDAICSQISEELYKQFCLPLHKELFSYIHSLGAKVKLHICGNITHLLPDLSKTDVDILDIDWMVDMTEAYKYMGDDVMLCGNMDPVSIVMNGNSDSIISNYESLKNKIPRKNWILMAGCEIPRDTPSENISLLRELSKNDGL